MRKVIDYLEKVDKAEFLIDALNEMMPGVGWHIHLRYFNLILIETANWELYATIDLKDRFINEECDPDLRLLIEHALRW